jgi:hypothetical protein
MSEKISKSEKSGRVGRIAKKAMKYSAIALASGAAGAATELKSNAAPAPDRTAVAAQQIENDIALKHAENILEGGTAVVEMQDGSQVNISNPIIARNGAVAERTRGSDTGELSAVTTYYPGEDGVKNVAYFDNAAGLDPDGFSPASQAIEATTPVIVQRANGLSGSGDPAQVTLDHGANYFVPATGETNAPAGQHIAEGTEYYQGNVIDS